MNHATPDPNDVITYVVAERNQTDDECRAHGHVTIPCRHCGEPIRAAGGDPKMGWFHDGGEDACETCECSEEYGPCEDHVEVFVQREGSSTRTADDLVYVFLTDVLAIAEGWEEDKRGDNRGDTTPDLAKLRDAVDYWSDDDRWDDQMGCRWVKDRDDSIHDDMVWGEQVAADLGLSVWWEDGYVISRVTGGPLLED